jgi:hypothetical protein
VSWHVNLEFSFVFTSPYGIPRSTQQTRNIIHWKVKNKISSIQWNNLCTEVILCNVLPHIMVQLDVFFHKNLQNHATHQKDTILAIAACILGWRGVIPDSRKAYPRQLCSETKACVVPKAVPPDGIFWKAGHIRCGKRSRLTSSKL